ncbi:MrpH family fimbial adhesin [Providencia sp. Je.9.19]|uniref:MrpH family fimbial adhesin n=1 Tax=Providencia sp. Je.9.19 TaxID=3142844 RepID=UPI003DA91B2F
MGKRIQQLLFVPLFFITFFSYASTYFSYVEEVEELKHNENVYHYQFDYWKASSPTEGNPCVALLGSAGAKNCYFTINHLHSGKDKGGVASRIDWDCHINFATYKTMEAIIGDARDRCGLTFPKKGSSQHSGAITTDECVGIFVARKQRQGSAKMLPGGICGIAPPPAGKCYFASVGNNTLELDHGSLNADELNGNTVSSMFSIMCNKDMGVRVSSNLQQNYVSLRPNNELQSMVTLNDQPASVGVLVSAQANRGTPIIVKSILRTSGSVAPGKFSGRITLVMTIP